MGGGYYEREVERTDAPSGYSEASAKILNSVTEINKALDPARCTAGPIESIHKHPIVFALDVTGSMGDWPKVIYDKLPMFYGQIMMQNYLSDPSVSFCAIGDVTCDKAPLQITDFGQGKEIDQLISKVYLEGGGGSGYCESYELSAYAYMNHCKLANAEMPFFFMTGDELFYKKIESDWIKRLGLPPPGQPVDAIALFQDLKKRYNVFLLRKPYSGESNNKIIENEWIAVLGKERILPMKTPKACIDVILGAIAITSGTRTLMGYVEDMKKREQEKDRIEEVVNALNEYAKYYAPNKVVGKMIKVEEPKKVEEIKEYAKKEAKAMPLASARSEFQKILQAMNYKIDPKILQFRENVKKQKVEIPQGFICPLTEEVFFDPVCTKDGVCYERYAIEAWLKHYDTSPKTGEILAGKELLPNQALKELIKQQQDEVIKKQDKGFCPIS